MGASLPAGAESDPVAAATVLVAFATLGSPPTSDFFVTGDRIAALSTYGHEPLEIYYSHDVRGSPWNGRRYATGRCTRSGGSTNSSFRLSVWILLSQRHER